MRRRAEVTGSALEDLAGEAIEDELKRDIHDRLTADRARYTATLDGLARRVAELAPELGELPRREAAQVVAHAVNHLDHDRNPEEDEFGHPVRVWHEAQLKNLTDVYAPAMGITRGRRGNGSLGPLEDTPLPDHGRPRPTMRFNR